MKKSPNFLYRIINILVSVPPMVFAVYWLTPLFFNIDIWIFEYGLVASQSKWLAEVLVSIKAVVGLLCVVYSVLIVSTFTFGGWFPFKRVYPNDKHVDNLGKEIHRIDTEGWVPCWWNIKKF